MVFSGYKSAFYLALFCACCASGQNVGLSMAHTTGLAGTKVSAPISLSADSQFQVAALEWSFSYPDADIVAVEVTAGEAAVAADKTVLCASTEGTTTCLLYGINRNLVSNGVVAEATFELSPRPHSSITVQLKNVIAVTPDSNSLPVSGDSEAKILVAPRPARRR
jgi:hypothetical protein